MPRAPCHLPTGSTRRTLDQRFAEQDAKWERRIAHLETRLIRWMVGLGMTGFGITIGLLIGLLKLWTG